MYVHNFGGIMEELPQQLYDRGFQLFLLANFKIRVGLFEQKQLLRSTLDFF